MHQTHGDGITPSPFSLSLSIPFLLPYLQSCDGTVCPDHVSLCIIFSQIYPTMNPPVIVRGERRHMGTDNCSVRNRNRDRVK